MGCYYLTASRGAEDEAVEMGDGMVFHSPGEVFRAFAEHKLGLHAKIRVRLPFQKKVISEVERRKRQLAGGRTAAEAERPRSFHRRSRWSSTTSCTATWRSTTCRSARSSLSRIIADCYQLLGRRETISLLDRHEGDRVPRIDPQRPVVRGQRPAHAGQQRRTC